jgi:hypothetical protein
MNKGGRPGRCESREPDPLSEGRGSGTSTRVAVVLLVSNEWRITDYSVMPADAIPDLSRGDQLKEIRADQLGAVPVFGQEPRRCIERSCMQIYAR